MDEDETLTCPRCGYEIRNSCGEGEWGNGLRLKVNTTDVMEITVYTCDKCGLVVMQNGIE